ncbi:MAG TPA: DUF58 domain-containing protein [Clostridiaceae bacterium]|nr:DUF58 domain-containing protein [Clostridiaceae bacterium]
MWKNRILYLSFLFLSLLFIYFYGGKIPYMMFYTVASLPVLSLAHSIGLFVSLKYIQKIDRQFVIKGDTIHYSLSISNESILMFPYVRAIFYGTSAILGMQFPEKSFSLPPFGKIDLSFKLKCNYRGNYEIGIKLIEIGDLLGMFKIKCKIKSPMQLTVYPKIINLEKMLLSSDSPTECNSNKNNTLFEDFLTILDIRKYAYGDSLKRVHWKLTAKAGELMVKKFQHTSEKETYLILDLKKNRFSPEENIVIEDKVIEVVISVIYYCLSSGIPVNLLYIKDKPVKIEANSLSSFDEIYKNLACIPFNEETGLEDILETFVADNADKTNIIAFTSNIDFDLYSQICRLQAYGQNIAIVYVSGEEVTGIKDPDKDNMLRSLRETGVNVFNANIHDDLKPILEQQVI